MASKKYWKHSVVGRVNGADNQTEVEVQRSLKRIDNILWERIYDLKDHVARYCPSCRAPIVKCNHCGKTFPTLGMVPPKQWADFRVISNGIHVLIECKETNWKDKFPTQNVKKEQIDFLVRNVMAGGKSYLFIVNRNREPLLNVISIQEYLSLISLSGNRTRFSIPLSLLDLNSMVLPRLPFHGEPFYDLSKLFSLNI